MSTADSEGAIVLGIGSYGLPSEGTIAFTVDSATRLGLGVALVHVVPTLIGAPTGTWDVSLSIDQLVREGEALLDRAVERVRDRMAGAQPVTGELMHGGAVATLVERSQRAQMVVLERRRLGRRTPLLDGSVSSGVAARAHAPVVCVPDDWTPPQTPRPIAVAVEDSARAPAELWTALGLAAVSDLPVQVVRATYLPEAYQEVLRREVKQEEWLAAARTELVRDADLPASVCERVPCTFEVRWGSAADVLVDVSRRSSLLVLGRRDPRLPLASHLGPVVRRVLRDAVCPVMVVEPSRQPGAAAA